MNVYAKYNQNVIKTPYLFSKWSWFKSRIDVITLIHRVINRLSGENSGALSRPPQPGGNFDDLEQTTSTRW